MALANKAKKRTEEQKKGLGPELQKYLERFKPEEREAAFQNLKEIVLNVEKLKQRDPDKYGDYKRIVNERVRAQVDLFHLETVKKTLLEDLEQTKEAWASEKWAKTYLNRFKSMEDKNSALVYIETIDFLYSSLIAKNPNLKKHEELMKKDLEREANLDHLKKIQNELEKRLREQK